MNEAGLFDLVFFIGALGVVVAAMLYATSEGGRLPRASLKKVRKATEVLRRQELR